MKLLHLPCPPDLPAQLVRVVFGRDPVDKDNEDGRRS